MVEFKTALSQSDEDLSKAAGDALKQIEALEYWQEFSRSDKPVYTIGVACYKKKCLVKVVQKEVF